MAEADNGTSNEYAITREYAFADWLQDGDVLVRTEYGSLLTESMLKDALLAQFEKACRKLGRNQRMRIRIEVIEAPEKE